MRTIIAGGRYITSRLILDTAILACPWSDEITAVLSGAAPGIDSLGEAWAYDRFIPVERFPANWNLRRKAGPIRNSIMVSHADALLAVWNGVSSGTSDVIQKATKAGLVVFVQRVDHK